MPRISIVIPARNEEKFIGKCLQTIIDQDCPKDSFEILVIDGSSTDRTKEIVEKYKIPASPTGRQNTKYNIRILDNPQKFTPFGLNIGIKNASGEIIIRMDAHAVYSRDYVAKCVKHLEESGADNVGGTVKTLPAKNTLIAKAIAFSLSNCFGAASDFRIGSKEVKEVDTVFGGCFKREIFNKVGFFNENLKRSQDLEFNLRIKKAGGKIFLFPEIIVEYYPQADLFKFFRHNIEDGIWSIYPLKFIKMKFKLRHYIPLVFILTLPLSIWPYVFGSLFFSAKIAAEEKDSRLFFVMPLAFAARHFGYGFGSLWGIVKLIKD